MTAAEYAHSYGANPVERERLLQAFALAQQEARAAALSALRAAWRRACGSVDITNLGPCANDSCIECAPLRALLEGK